MADNMNGVMPGMIEAHGLVPAVEVVNAMTKAVEVHLTGREFVGGSGSR